MAITVLKNGAERIRKIECPECLSVLEFFSEDIDGVDKNKTIICPVCSEVIPIKKKDLATV